MGLKGLAHQFFVQIHRIGIPNIHIPQIQNFNLV